MINKIPFLILFLFFSCVSKEEAAKNIESSSIDTSELVIVKQEASNRLEELNFEYDFKIYNHKDSIDINELITSTYDYDRQEAKLDSPKIFLYMDSKRQIRISTFLNNQWQTWSIYDAENEKYFAKIDRQNFDNVGNDELIIQSEYGLELQSTVGSSYYGSFQVWNIDSVKLYFDIENYEYLNDYGRNGDHSFEHQCSLAVEVKEKEIFVNALEVDSIGDSECSLDNEYSGKYLLENGKVIKQKK